MRLKKLLDFGKSNEYLLFLFQRPAAQLSHSLFTQLQNQMRIDTALFF